ncbi:hypothetical protein EJ08DRAFT_697298 [Tothia fuscella]|uniref:Uncharacterized protein n=1 Tax=Tothia fuscella TaxID=1048955 RepID=A0A9P4NR44_9PEZI|nr:hypothetical protein EJ08DRAFT_697298 [Tothia fuscella]
MSNSCTTVSTNGLLSQNFTGGGSSSYSCAFLSNYTLASQCCSSISPPQKFANEPCYSWCDLPASMDAQFDSDEVDYFQYFKGCLNATGETTGPLWCHAQPHIFRPTGTTTTTTTKPTSTFNAATFCATQNPQVLISVPDPKPACGILPNHTNTNALERCCQPAPVQWSIIHCYEYCGLPMGSGFRGVGNLTYDETLGSFKTCLLQEGNNSQSVLEGIICRSNGTPIDLQNTTFGTTKYLTGTGGRWSANGVLIAMAAVFASVSWFTSASS